MTGVTAPAPTAATIDRAVGRHGDPAEREVVGTGHAFDPNRGGRLPVVTAFLVPARFNGPPESGNGGWASGRVAAGCPPRTPVRMPCRCGFALPHRSTAGSSCRRTARRARAASAASGSTTARSWSRQRWPPPLWRDRSSRRSRSPTRVAGGAFYEGLADHPFPTCYSCGTARTDGLSLRPGRVAGRAGAYAASWTPAEVDPGDRLGGAGLPRRLGRRDRRAPDGPWAP